MVFPVHPRTQKIIGELGETFNMQLGIRNVTMIEPASYLDMLTLEQNARLILTDSGGVRKEAYFFAAPCATLRPETEWLETVETGWNVLVGADRERIVQVVNGRAWPGGTPPAVFGDGHASQRIVQLLGEGG